MEFIIKGVSIVKLQHEQGDTTSSHVSTDFNLDVSDNVDSASFLDAEGLPTEDGVKALTQCFVQGLVGNIHSAHQKKYWDSAEHLRYIITELERGFIQVSKTYKSTFDS